KELAEIERGWRALKSTLLLRPVHHWTEDRIKAHIFINQSCPFPSVWLILATFSMAPHKPNPYPSVKARDQRRLISILSLNQKQASAG
ncbi:MAG: hypothetical protein CVU53_07470, partial [Deltaproteobacteria bacterium HGW-Deltaproteobacteria-11]